MLYKFAPGVGGGCLSTFMYKSDNQKLSIFNETNELTIGKNIPKRIKKKVPLFCK